MYPVSWSSVQSWFAIHPGVETHRNGTAIQIGSIHPAERNFGLVYGCVYDEPPALASTIGFVHLDLSAYRRSATFHRKEVEESAIGSVIAQIAHKKASRRRHACCLLISIPFSFGARTAMTWCPATVFPHLESSAIEVVAIQLHLGLFCEFNILESHDGKSSGPAIRSSLNACVYGAESREDVLDFLVGGLERYVSHVELCGCHRIRIRPIEPHTELALTKLPLVKLTYCECSFGGRRIPTEGPALRAPGVNVPLNLAGHHCSRCREVREEIAILHAPLQVADEESA